MSQMVRPGNPSPLVPASALALALGDWLAFALNIATLISAYWLVVVLSALSAGAFVAVVQWRAGDDLPTAYAKCAAVALIIALPLPLLGSVVGSALLAWALVDHVMRRRSQSARA